MVIVMLLWCCYDPTEELRTVISVQRQLMLMRSCDYDAQKQRDDGGHQYWES